MNWIKKLNLFKIIIINLLVFIFIIIFLEVGFGILRLFIGKEYFMPQIITGKLENITSPFHPCNEMRTDVLLSHVNNHKNLCKIKDGEIFGEYVSYNFSSLEKPILLTLGGSTTSGFYQHYANGNTYPRILAEISRDKYHVLNGGVGAYSSLQEMLKFMRDGPRFKNLAIVVSLNGINELPDYHGPNLERGMDYPFLTNLQNTMNKKEIWIDQKVRTQISNRLVRYLPNIVNSYLGINHILSQKKIERNDDKKNLVNKNNLSEEKKVTNNILSNDTKLLTSNDDQLFKNINNDLFFFYALGAADRWEANVKRLNALVNLQGAKYYLFLQPALGLKGIQSEPKKNSRDETIFRMVKNKTNYIKRINDLYFVLKTRCKKLSFCFDISNEVPPTGNMYYDERHHNEKGNELLANIIFEKIQQK